MYWLKSCPRCQGDLHQEEDLYGTYIACIQCGYALTIMEEHALRTGGEIRGESASSPSVTRQSKVA